MIPVWIPLGWLYQLWPVIPVVAAVLLMSFGMGAAAGADDVQTADIGHISHMVTELRDLPVDVAAPFNENQDGAPISIEYSTVKPMVQVMTDTALEGYWYGMQNPKQGALFAWIAPTGAIALLAVYFYTVFKIFADLLGWVR